jgi:hypothetical protein
MYGIAALSAAAVRGPERDVPARVAAGYKAVFVFVKKP